MTVAPTVATAGAPNPDASKSLLLELRHLTTQKPPVDWKEVKARVEGMASCLRAFDFGITDRITRANLVLWYIRGRQFAVDSTAYSERAWGEDHGKLALLHQLFSERKHTLDRLEERRAFLGGV
uniref:Serine/threonine-protein kinase ATR n=1 Tax=Anthurium amnicola TaxID=1678845 RepID=A0A1D1ZBA5_9ARAE